MACQTTPGAPFQPVSLTAWANSVPAIASPVIPRSISTAHAAVSHAPDRPKIKPKGTQDKSHNVIPKRSFTLQSLQIHKPAIFAYDRNRPEPVPLTIRRPGDGLRSLLPSPIPDCRQCRQHPPTDPMAAIAWIVGTPLTETGHSGDKYKKEVGPWNKGVTAGSCSQRSC